MANIRHIRPACKRIAQPRRRWGCYFTRAQACRGTLGEAGGHRGRQWGHRNIAAQVPQPDGAVAPAAAPTAAAARPLLRVLMLRMMRGSARTRGGVTTSRRVTGGAQEHQSVNAHARGAAAADELLLAVRTRPYCTAAVIRALR